MAIELRKTGISVVGDVPWGTHFCYFYETKRDLLDTLVPYFKAGLESKEFCLWVVSNSELITVEEARGALRQAVPDLVRYLAEGRIEVVSHDQWFLKGGAFDRHRVANGLKEKLKEALARGYAGMRINGSPAWLHDEGQKELRKFEEELDKLFTNERIITSCTYPLAAIGGDEVFDVVRTHQFAIARRQGKWEVIETPQLIQAKAEIERLNEALEQRVAERTRELVAANEALKSEIDERRRVEQELRERAADLAEAQRVAKIGNWVFNLSTNKVTWSEELYRIFEIEKPDFDGNHELFVSRVHHDDQPRVLRTNAQTRIDGSPFDIEYRIITPNGQVRIIREVGYAAQDEAGNVIRLFGTAQDITERKWIEEKLRQSESQLAEAQRLASVGSWNWEIRNNTYTWSDELYRMCGLLPHEADPSYETFIELVHPDDRAVVRGVIKHALKTQEPINSYFRIVRPDGAERIIHSRGNTIGDSSGTPIRMHGTVQDVTARKQAEAALRESQARTQLLVKCSNIGLWDWDLLTNEVFFSPEWRRQLGHADHDLPNRYEEWESRLHPEDREPTLAAVKDFREGRRADYDVEFRLRHKDGSWRWILTRADMIRDAAGQPVRMMGCHIDITGRKRAEQALHQAEQKYRELFENAKDAIYVHDLSGRYTSLNRAAEQLSGYAREQILGKDFSNFVSPESVEHVRENLCRKLRQEGETTYEVEITTKDGRRVPVEVSSRLIYDEGVPVAVQGTARNIAERKRAEEALRGYSRQLIRAQEAERESIARELHDQIGQVLTAIRINLETIRDSSHRAESNALIDEGVTIVDEAIQQVRELSFELRPSLLDDLGLPAALRWYADRFAQRTGIHTQTSISPESRIRLPREIETASFRIVQEALINVARHAQARNVSIDVRTLNGALSLSIKDDGVGFNSHSLINGVSLSSLGLRGMEERAHGLGGKLEIKSVPDEGTEVRVHFPNGSKRREST